MTFLKNPLNFIKKANKTFNIYLENYKRIDSFLNEYEKDQKKNDTFFNAFLDIYGENQKKTDESLERYGMDQEKTSAFLSALLDAFGENKEKMDVFFDKYEENQKKKELFIENYNENQKKIEAFANSYISIKDDLTKAIDTFNKNYYSCKDYFFNSNEHLFKEIMDTDQFFQMCFFNNIKLLSYSSSENRIQLKTEDGVILATNNRFYTIKEIFASGGYSIPHLHQFKNFVVFDIGMNRGYAALKFANFDSCKAVYGFEINQETYDFALENFNLNPSIAHKIKPYNFGLSNENGEVDIYCLPGSDGITTTELEFTNIQGEWLKWKERMEIKKAKVKDASAVLLELIENDNIASNIILKIDTEGSEHKIIDNLISNGVLDKIDLIMGENHIKSEDIGNKLVGFKEVNKFHHSDTIYSFCYVKEQYYNVLPLSG